jgi:predicted permease
MKWEDNLDKELRFHLEQAVQDYVARGMSEREARERARRDFGSVALAKEEIRDTRPLRWLADFVQDVRYALRGFRQRPGFAATAIVVLALGIGANTAVFTLLHRVLLASLPVQNPEELVELSCTNPFGPGEVGCASSYPGFQMFAERTDLFTGIFAFSEFPALNVIHDGSGEVARGLLASGSFFNTLGVSPAAGRLFNPTDDDPAAAPVAVLSYAYWQRRFGADPGILGKAYPVNGIPVTFIGVTPPSFRNVTLDATPDLTLPLAAMTDRLQYPGALRERGNWWLQIIARKRPEVGFGQIQAALAPVFSRTVEDMIDALGADMPASLGVGLRSMRFVPLPAATGATSEMRRDLDRPLRILMSAVAMVFLIACANLGGLMLARSAARRREFGVRVALGAGRARLFRQLLTESWLLAVFGAAAGILTSAWTQNTLLYLAAGENGARAVDSGLDASVLAFTMGVSLLAAFIIGIVPALRLSSADPHNAVRETPGAGSRSRFGRTLTPAQVGLTVVLLIGAVLFLRTFENFPRVDLGYQADELLSFRVSPQLVNYDAANSRVFFTAMQSRLESLPGVIAVTLSQRPVGDIGNRTAAFIPGFETRNFDDWMISRNWIGARFAETTGLRLLQGRDFTAADLTSSQLPAIVNESFARHYFETTEAVGKKFTVPRDTFTVVGVVADAHDRGPKADPERTVYVPLERGARTAFVTIRARSAPESLIPAVQAALREIDAAVPVDQMQTARDFVEGQLSRERLLATLSSAFGLLALLLVAVGLYGLIAGAVAARTRELGIRVALGAQPASVAWLVTRESVKLVVIGAALGLASGAYLARFVESQLFGVTPGDPWAYAAATLALIAAGALAAYLPARRATRVDPMEALRCD